MNSAHAYDIDHRPAAGPMPPTEILGMCYVLVLDSNSNLMLVDNISAKVDLTTILHL